MAGIKASLEVRTGKSAGTKVELNKLGSFTIGRRTESDLSLRDSGVSRHHCRIDFDGEHFWLVDCESHNGTIVNGHRVTRSLLYNGDVIKVGRVEMVIAIAEERDPTAVVDLHDI